METMVPNGMLKILYDGFATGVYNEKLWKRLSEGVWYFNYKFKDTSYRMLRKPNECTLTITTGVDFRCDMKVEQIDAMYSHNMNFITDLYIHVIDIKNNCPQIIMLNMYDLERKVWFMNNCPKIRRGEKEVGFDGEEPR